MKNFGSIVVVMVCALFLQLKAQAPDTVRIPYNVNDPPGTINNAIQGDTLANGNRVNPNRWYKLDRGGFYLLNGWITVKQGTHIRIIGEPAPASGQDLGPAVIMPGAVTGVYYTQNFDSFGDLTLKNVWMFMVDNSGALYWNQLFFENVNNLHGTFDNVIFDWDIAPTIRVQGQHFVGKFTNSIFRNLIDPSQWWSGRQIYFEAGSTGDTIWSENNTFENMGFVYQTQGRPVHRTYYNHNTFVNISKFSLQESDYWTWLVCTNNLFINNHFTGERASDRIGQDKDQFLWGQVINVDSLPGGAVNDGTETVTEMQRVIFYSNNNVYTEPWFQTFYDAYNDTVPVSNIERWILPEPEMSERTTTFFDGTYPHPFIKRANIYSEDPGFKVAPTNKDSILKFLKDEYSIGANTNWGFNYDLSAVWPLKEKLDYSNATLKTAGFRGYPLGDLNWFPEQKATWKSEDDWAVINPLLSVKQIPGGTTPTNYALNQNYPNPFNPSTQITYSVAKKGFVSLKVYDITGKEIATIFAGEQEAGEYKASFNGSTLASGVYLYRLEAGNQSISKKMVLMK